MKHLNQKGLSLVQALVTLALLSGIGVMTMNIAEKQSLAQKRIQAQSDLDNAIKSITQTLTDGARCMADFMNSTAPPNTLQTIPLGSAPGVEDIEANRTQFPNPTLTNKAGKVVLGAGAAQFNNIMINRLDIGPIETGAGAPAMQQVDLWIQYIRETGDSSGGAATLTVQQWTKLDNALTVKLNGGVVENCFTNETTIIDGLDAGCSILGGTYDGTDSVCDLVDASATAEQPNDSVNVLSMEDRFTDLTTWANANILKLNSDTPQTFTGDLTVTGNVTLANSNENDPTSALSLDALKRLLQIPPPTSLCASNEIGYIHGSQISCINRNSLTCGNGQKMIGFSASGPICQPLLGDMVECAAGESKRLVTDPATGGVEFECFPPPTPIYTYTCTATGWSLGAQCPPGPQGALCTSGSPIQGDSVCCETTPVTVCAIPPSLAQYTCNMTGGGWSGPGPSCASESPDCSTTTAVADGTVMCCSDSGSGPNPVKCPSSTTTLYRCATATGTWTTMTTGCSSPSVDLGFCTAGTATNGDAACCTSPPVGTCPSASNMQYTCSSGSWSVGSTCGSVSGACTSGSGNEGDTACCASAPTTTCNAPKRLYECVASGGWVDNGTCSSTVGAGFCNGSSGPALGAETACCSTSPASACAGNQNKRYTCNFATGWSGPGTDCGFSTSSICASGTPTNGQTACCPSGAPPTTTCAAPPPTYTRYRCQSSSWVPISGTCSSSSNCTGTHPDLTNACCTSPPTGTCQPPVPTLNPYRCNGSSWVAGAHGCTTTPSGPCTSGSGATGTLACCSSSPSTPCNYAGFQWRCASGVWSPLGTACTTGTLGQCTSGTIGHLSTVCCPAPGPTNTCGTAPPKITSGSAGTSGSTTGSCPGNSCTGGSTCLPYCPPAYQCSVYAGNCPASAPTSACQSICTTAGNHACYSGTVTDFNGGACF